MNLMEELTNKVNQLLSESIGLDLALSLIANNESERIEIRLLATQTLTNDQM